MSLSIGVEEKTILRFIILGADNGPVGNERAIVSIARKHEFRGAREYTGAII